MRKQTGFTLIELMIVIAILGILMAIAIPAYNDYTIRAKVSEGINMAAGAKLAVSEYRLSEGTWPAGNTAAGLAATISSEYVKSLTVATTLVTITYQAIDAAVNDKTLTLSAALSASGAVDWTCSVGTIDPKYVPSSCR
jgi:type IV pilus assembly protein PilA